jgi:hypothetical protein
MVCVPRIGIENWTQKSGSRFLMPSRWHISAKVGKIFSLPLIARRYNAKSIQENAAMRPEVARSDLVTGSARSPSKRRCGITLSRRAATASPLSRPCSRPTPTHLKRCGGYARRAWHPVRDLNSLLCISRGTMWMSARRAVVCRKSGWSSRGGGRCKFRFENDQDRERLLFLKAGEQK